MKYQPKASNARLVRHRVPFRTICTRQADVLIFATVLAILRWVAILSRFHNSNSTLPKTYGPRSVAGRRPDMGCFQSKVENAVEPVNNETYETVEGTDSKRLSIMKNVDSWIVNNNEYVAKSTIDKRIIEILKERKTKMEADGTFKKRTNFERVALQFGNVEIAFMSIRDMFTANTDSVRLSLPMPLVPSSHVCTRRGASP